MKKDQDDIKFILYNLDEDDQFHCLLFHFVSENNEDLVNLILQYIKLSKKEAKQYLQDALNLDNYKIVHIFLTKYLI